MLPPEVLASISAYYRRVTTEAYPMNRLIALVMLLTFAAIFTEVVQGEYQWWIGWGSLLLAGGGFVPTMMRTVPNARRLGGAQDSAEEQSTARARDLPGSHVQFRADERGADPAVDRAIERFRAKWVRFA